jgi:hypothetical protein
MQKRRIEHTFDCEPDTYWDDAFFNPEYNTKLFLERLRFERWEVIEQVDTDDGFRRIIEAVPRVGDLPGPIKSLLKNGAGYREEGEFRRAESRYTLSVTSKSLGSKLLVTGDMSVQALGDGRCRREYECTVTAKVFGVGGMLERRVLDDWERSYLKAAEFTVQWLSDHRPASG